MEGGGGRGRWREGEVEGGGGGGRGRWREGKGGRGGGRELLNSLSH